MKPEPITVTQLNSYIKDKIAGDEFLNTVYIKGEISDPDLERRILTTTILPNATR